MPESPAERVKVAIVGGGITGLSAAAWLELDHGIKDVLVLESEARPGGKVQSESKDGHVLEWGPQGFLDNAPDTLELAEAMRLGQKLVKANEAAADRFIVRDGLLHSVPLSPAKFMRSPILSVGGRLRLLMEPFARSRTIEDESVFQFAQRRIGSEAAEILVDAMTTGVFAGNSRELSLAATFPRMAEMENRHGSLTRAMLDRMRQRRRDGGTGGGPAGPGGTLTTFEGGMEQLPIKLASFLGDRLRSSTPILSIHLHSNGLRIKGQDCDLVVERLLLATPAHVAGRLLAQLLPQVAEPLNRITTVPISIVNSSYSSASAFDREVSGFGFLVPGREPHGILGTLFCHDIFPGQVPPNRLLLRTMIGGAREPGAALESDSSLETRARTAHSTLLGSNPDPDNTWIIRHERGISQYGIGHLDRIEEVETAAAEFGIELAGSPYRGVSVNDCIRQARATAARLSGASASRAE